MYENWSVYVHINKLNNKRYVGITSLEPESRWGSNGCNYRNHNGKSKFKNAINKYGWDNFGHHIIFKNLLRYEAYNWECQLISIFNTTDDRYGYNIEKGGNVIKKNKCTGNTAYQARQVVCLNTGTVYETMSIAAQYYKTTRNTIKKNCENKVFYAGKDENGTLLVWKYLEDYKLLTPSDIAEIINDPKSYLNSSPVICLNDQNVFHNGTDAADYYKIKSPAGIYACCKKIRKSCGIDENGYRLEWMYYEEFKSMSYEDRKIRLNFRRKKNYVPCNTVICLNTLEIFDGFSNATKYTTLKRSSYMYEKMKHGKPHGKNKISGEDLYWMLLDDYNKLNNKEKNDMYIKFYTGHFLMSEKEGVANAKTNTAS